MTKFNALGDIWEGGWTVTARAMDEDGERPAALTFVVETPPLLGRSYDPTPDEHWLNEQVTRLWMNRYVGVASRPDKRLVIDLYVTHALSSDYDTAAYFADGIDRLRRGE